MKRERSVGICRDGNVGGFIPLRGADRSRHDRRAAVVEGFERYFGPRARKVEAYIEKSWSSDPWARGCYAGYMTPGTWVDYGPALREAVGRVHWAGTETATYWSGYMDGAVSSGRRAAAEVVAKLR